MLRLTARLAVTTVAATGLALGATVAPAYAVAPDTTITSGPQEPNNYLLPGPVTFTFSSDQPIATFQCQVDNGQYADCTSPDTYDLPPGTHFFRVRAVKGGVADATPAERYWVIRNVPCEQAGAAYAMAQGKYFTWQAKLVKAKRALHRAHAHGTARQLQHAKDHVRRVKAKIATYRTEMDQALAQEQAVC